MAKFTVVVGFGADCCAKSHLWVEVVEARSREEAARKARKEVAEAECEPSDCVVFDGQHSHHFIDAEEASEREKFEDDGQEYGHPGDFLRGLE